MNDKPVKSDAERSMLLHGIADGLEDALREIFGERSGFILVTFPFDRERTEVQYTANCERADGTMILRQLLSRWESGLPDVPFHRKN